MSEYIIAIIGDTHIGSSTALSPLQFTIHNRATLEEQITYANRLQEWLYECWIDYWDYVYQLCNKGKKGKKLVVIHLGDVIDGNHHNSNQLVQVRRHDPCAIAESHSFYERGRLKSRFNGADHFIDPVVVREAVGTVDEAV